MRQARDVRCFEPNQSTSIGAQLCTISTSRQHQRSHALYRPSDILANPGATAAMYRLVSMVNRRIETHKKGSAPRRIRTPYAGAPVYMAIRNTETNNHVKHLPSSAY
jgi:hypothetical protein